MTNFTRGLSIAAFSFFCGISLKSYSQQKIFTKEQAAQLISKSAGALNLGADDIRNTIVTDAYYDKVANINIVYLQQAYKGVPVYNAIKTIAFKNDKVVSTTGAFAGKLIGRVNVPEGIPSIAPADAVSSATGHVNYPVLQKITPVTADEIQKKYDFGTLGAAKENVTAKLTWVADKDGKLKLCWQVKYMPLKTSEYWLINVDATNNTIVSKNNLTDYDNWRKPASYKQGISGIANAAAAFRPESPDAPPPSGDVAIASAKYRVIAFPAESMTFPGGKPVLVTNPWLKAGANNNVAVLGWNNDGKVNHDSTRGNNVWAREDTANNNGFPFPGAAAKSTTPSPSLTFNFTFDSTKSPHSSTNQKFAITQLFYANNIMHDISYQYGFDEASGNFQDTNLARGGLGKDYVIADAQDGGGTDNANFSTPDDGQHPRMQMYLFPRPQTTINSPVALKGNKKSKESGFSSNNSLSKVGPVTGNVVLYDSTSAEANFACTALSGKPLSGKIVLIDRGICAFVNKVKNAQDAGAKAVIVVNNVAGDAFTMGGDDNTITIPAVMISLDDGNAIRAAINNHTTVNATLKTGIALDGDLDNGVMAHEYTHGISNRLTGGPSNSGCLENAEQMGEGWSDYFALMTTTDWSTAKITDGAKARTLGTYLLDQDPVTGAGFRNYPYSTDQTIDPWSYEYLADFTGGEPHNVGEIWTTALWDMTWNIIQMDGINPDLYKANAIGGNSVALKLVTEGMKLQPCSPGFLDGRDGILKADTLLYNGKYSCAIWRAFAGRGMGINAKEGSSNDYTDQVADYTPNTAIVKKSADKVEAAQSEIITYTLKATCNCGPISNYTIVDTLPSNVTYVSGGAYNAITRTVTFNVASLNSAQSQSFTFTARVNNGTYTSPATVLTETVTGSKIPNKWDTTNTGAGRWTVSNTRSHSAPYSLKAFDADTVSRQVLATVSSYNVKGISTLSFWHYYKTEAGYDKGTVEISSDSGATWIDANEFIIKNGYNYNIGFSGDTPDSTNFIQTIVNLSSFNNKKIKIRFVFTSDQYVGAEGWYIDDIQLKNIAGVYNQAQLFDDNGDLQHTSDTVTMITNNILPIVWGDFTAEKKGNAGLLKWTTEQEHNTAKFVIERSADGIVFQAIGSVQALGETSSASNYTLTDAVPVSGANYYRIRQVDKDGIFTYSEVRLLRFDQLSKSIVLTPNPAKDKIAITITGNNKLLQAVLLNSSGQKLDEFNINGQYTQHTLPKSAPGVYYLKIKGDNIAVTKKLVIE